MQPILPLFQTLFSGYGRHIAWSTFNRVSSPPTMTDHSVLRLRLRMNNR
jgi:hypothetical protein